MSTPQMIIGFNEPERLLYHYTSLEKARDLILKSGRLRMGNYKLTNDPKESKSWEFSIGSSGNLPLAGYNMVELSERLSNALKDRARVLCFSMDSEPLTGDHTVDIHRRGFAYPRMWAQYGNRHKGVCMVFDKAKLEEKMQVATHQAIFAYAGKVSYLDRPIVRNLDETDYSIWADHLEKVGFDAYWRWHLGQHSGRLFFEKLSDWRDEREFRYVLFVEPEEEVFVNFGESLVGVVFGDSANPDTVDDVVQMLLPTKIELTGLKWTNCSPWYDFGNLKYTRELWKSPWGDAWRKQTSSRGSSA